MAIEVGFTPATPAGWPTPIEPIWHMLTASGTSTPQCKRPDVSLSDRLFIGAVVNLPREHRPWGCVTWLAEVFRVSRPTVYALAAKLKAQVLTSPPEPELPVGQPTPAPSSTGDGPSLRLTRNRLGRTLLTLLMPGGVSIGAVVACLQVAFEPSRSVGFISELVQAAGRRAGPILEPVDPRPLGPVVLARDEIFTGSAPNLLLVEPHSLTITGLYATRDRSAETWAGALLLTQDRGVEIAGLAEDGGIPYAASCRLAGLEAAIQKDVWHPLADAQQVVTDLEREAWQALTLTDRLEKRRTNHWPEADFAAYLVATDQAEQGLAHSAALRFWRGCLWDAVERVDWRSGEIRERAINEWLLTETLTALKTIPHPRVQKLVERLAAQAPEMLTFLEGLTPALAAWPIQRDAHFPDSQWANFFQARVARCWRLEHAVRGGQTDFRRAAQEARQFVTELSADDPTAHRLAEDLWALLEKTVRTSSAAETVNSVLRPYFNGRREGTADTESRQLFLNLFMLWFNLHKFESGPRQGHSPYELAGINLGTDDWLTVLGFPPD